jgi:DNA-binding CsgD family transcriptional regulator
VTDGVCDGEMVKATPQRVRAELVDLARTRLSVFDLGPAVSNAVGRMVPHEGYVLIWFDPISALRGLAIGENALQDSENLLVDNEAFHDDLNKFTDLAARARPVGLLGTGAPTERHSIRLHELIRPEGFTSEARLVLRSAAHMWGALVLLRAGRCFHEHDATHLARLAQPLARVVSRHPVDRVGATTPDPPPPGVILLGPHNTVEAISAQAHTWLNDLWSGPYRPIPLPRAVYAAANAARLNGPTTPNQRGEPTLTRIRTATGRWLTLHSYLLDPDPGGRIVITLQAADPLQLLPALLAWTGLTPRETHIVHHLLAGTPVKQIARRLDLSALTVNDHLKAIYRKTNTHGRDELAAYLTTRMP